MSDNESCYASCYDLLGFKRIRVELRVGDEVDYKADGTSGSFRALVLAIRKRVKIELRKKNGVDLPSPRTTWVNPRFLSVWRDGKRITERV